MKKIFLPVFFFLLPLFSIYSLDYIMYNYDTSDTENINAHVTDVIDQGYTPVGIDITYGDDGTELLNILFILDSSIQIDSWQIKYYYSNEELQEGVTSLMSEGWLAKDVSFAGEVAAVLFLGMDHSATAWWIEFTEFTEDNMVDNVNHWVNKEGYTPYGISGLDEELWLLYVKFPSVPIKEWLIEWYDFEEYEEGIYDAIDKEFIPWGLMVRNGYVYILYLK